MGRQRHYQRRIGGLEAAAYRQPCGMHAAMARAEAAWRRDRELRAVTLADLVAHMQTTLDPRGQVRASAWLLQHVRGAAGSGRVVSAGPERSVLRDERRREVQAVVAALFQALA